MSSDIPQIPLNRGGDLDYTEETITLYDYTGDPLAKISRAPNLVLTYDAIDATDDAFDTLQDMEITTLTDIFSEAGERFTGQGYDDWIENVVRATGRTWDSAERAGETIAQSFQNMAAYLEVQAPSGDLTVYDSYSYDRGDGERLDFVPEARNLGVVSPSNHPMVQILPILGLAAKIPLINRPSDNEPFTACRIAESLYEAGLPEDSLHLLPGSREFGHRVITSTDKGVIFGSDNIVEQYATAPDIKTYGPGNSKMIIDVGHVDDSDVLAAAKEGMISDGGRGCINESQFIVLDNSEKFAYSLVEEVVEAEIRDPLDPRAEVPAVPVEKAEQWNDFISRHLEQDGVRDVTEELRPGRVVYESGAAFLRPTVIHIDFDVLEDGEHELFRELPFQYCAVTNASKEDLPKLIQDSLSVSLHTDNDEIVDAIRMEPTVDKVHVAESSCNFDLSNPHQGYIIDYLYKKKGFNVGQEYRRNRSEGVFSSLRQIVGI